MLTSLHLQRSIHTTPQLCCVAALHTHAMLLQCGVAKKKRLAAQIMQMLLIYCSVQQGCSQPHGPGRARFPLSSFFLKF